MSRPRLRLHSAERDAHLPTGTGRVQASSLPGRSPNPTHPGGGEAETAFNNFGIVLFSNARFPLRPSALAFALNTGGSILVTTGRAASRTFALHAFVVGAVK